MRLFKRVSSFWFFLFLLCIIGLIFLSIASYVRTLKSDLLLSADKTLSEIMLQQKYNFHAKITANFREMVDFSQIVSYWDERDSNELKNTIAFLVRESEFEHVFVTDKKGNVIAGYDKAINISEYDFFKSTLSGMRILTDPLSLPFLPYRSFVFSVPILKKGVIIGIVAGMYNASYLDDLFLTSFAGKGYAFITNSSGDIIAKNVSKYTISLANIFETFKKARFLNYDNYNQIVYTMEASESGHSVYQIDGQTRLMNYAPININGWYIFSIVPEDVILEEANKISIRTMRLTTAVIVAFLLLMLYLTLTQRLYEKKLYKAAFFDELTGVPNLAKFKADAQKIVSENPDLHFIFIEFDMVQFKMINEMFDFATGDQVIKIIAETCRKKFEAKNHAFARISSDKFILLDMYEPETKESHKEHRIIFENTLKQQIKPILPNHKVEFKYGRYYPDAGETDMNSIVEKVNLAHHIAKTQKNNPVCEYDETFKKRVIQETEIENIMEDALENQEFVVFLQAKYTLNNEQVAGAEALVRWKKTQKDGTVLFTSPAMFIPLFEKNGFIVELDFYMLKKVCAIIKNWIDSALIPVTVSVNFSRMHLLSDNLVANIVKIVDSYGIPRDLIEIELTESVIFDNEELLQNILKSLHKAGFSLSMDDFGTGYSSLGLLKNLPVDVLKIDRGFFTGNENPEREKAVIFNVIQMAHDLNMHTVAEGVEIKTHVDFLREVGCDMVQGYYFAKPIPEKEFAALLKPKNEN